MEEQVPASNFPPIQQGITPEQLEQLKSRAREAAIMQTYQQNKKPVEYQMSEPLPPGSYEKAARILAPNNPLPSKIVYVKRSLTVAEVGLMLLLSCGIVFGIQVAVDFASKTLPRIEIKMK